MSDLEKLAGEMAEHGVRRVYGIPGSGPSYSLIAALDGRGVDFVRTYFEGSAALMAGGEARLRGRAGVALSIKGPGLANLLPGLAACRLETLPVVSVSEAYPPSRPWRGSHKGMDHRALVRGVTKGARFLSPDGPGFRALARWAEAEVPGPVHLDIAATGVEAEAPIPEHHDEASERGCDDRFVEILARAERPVVIASNLAVRRGWSEWLNRLRVPVFSTAAAKGVVDENLAHAAGVYTGVGLARAPEYSLLPAADCVVGLGLRSADLLSAPSVRCPLVNVEPTSNADGSCVRASETITGTRAEIRNLASVLAEKSWGLEALARVRATLRDRLLASAFLPAIVYDTIERHFAGRLRIVLDTGYFCTIGEHVCRVTTPDRYLAAGRGRYMGVALPMAIGGALADPAVPTVAYVGDGGIGMFVSESRVAIERRLPLLVVLMRDGHYASVRARALRDSLTSAPVDIQSPSWVDIMEGMGMPATRVGDVPALESALQSWDPDSGPAYVEAVFDAQAYRTMVCELRD